MQGVLEHHVQIPASGHAVIAVFWVHAHLVQDGIHPAFRDEDVVGDNDRVVFPPAAKGEGLGGLVAVHIEGDGELAAEFRFHPQQFQHVEVCGGLISALSGQAALDGITEHPVGLIGVGITDLHMGFVEGDIRGHTAEPPQAPFFDQRVLTQFLKLRLCQIFETAMGILK